MTPSILVSLIDAMTPQELLGNLATIKRDGAFDNPEIKELVQSKLEFSKKARKGKMDALKGETTLEAVNLDEETKQIVQDITDAQIKQHGSIGAKTALLIDKSTSMRDAIELGKKIGASIAQAGGDKFKACYLFGTDPVLIQWTEADGDMTSYTAWAKKLRMQVAGGRTDIGKCLRAMMRSNISVEQIVLITDEGENGSPTFSTLLHDYKKQFGHMPSIVIVRLGQYAQDKVERGCKHSGAEVDVVHVSDIDKVSIPNLIQLLSRKSLFDLVQEIMETPLPTRKAWMAAKARKSKNWKGFSKANESKLKKNKAEKSTKSGQHATVG